MARSLNFRRSWRVALPLALAGIGVAAQAAATWRDRHRYPAPGTLIDVGGHRLHLVRAGTCGPVVVLDAGLGAFSVDWRLVAPAVASHTTVCAYDRAGYGWSDPAPGPRTSRRIARDLHILLHAADLPGPYVLVGHSFGGFNARIFADRYPDEVAGLVLLDASDEDVARRLPGGLRVLYRRLLQIEPLVWQVGRLCSALGVVRLAGACGFIPPFAAFDTLPPAARRLAHALRYRPRYYATCYAEDVAFPISAAQVRQTRSLPHIPVAVVVATGSAGLSIGADALPGPAQDVAQALLRQKEQMARALAGRLSPDARVIVAERSGHLIPLDQPDVVVDAICSVVEAVRRAQPAGPWRG